MNRRSYLRVAGVATAGVTAGCPGPVFGRERNPTVLEPPEDRQYDSSELPYPAHGQELPRIRLPDPLSGTEIDTADLEETLVVTAFFASCPVECVLLVGQLARVQCGTLRAGLAEEVTFLANPEGVVERAYRTDAPDHERVLSDVKTVASADL